MRDSEMRDAVPNKDKDKDEADELGNDNDDGREENVDTSMVSCFLIVCNFTYSTANAFAASVLQCLDQSDVWKRATKQD
jgi:hypothetical protein